mmetsp:Transcript_51404/g.122167  ORF Transcript_51404/g.122167 Transcript_51404/m.122167 type:complete len:361 (-) Transcript_51404:652-1734(-)
MIARGSVAPSIAGSSSERSKAIGAIVDDGHRSVSRDRGLKKDASSSSSQTGRSRAASPRTKRGRLVKLYGEDRRDRAAALVGKIPVLPQSEQEGVITKMLVLAFIVLNLLCMGLDVDSDWAAPGYILVVFVVFFYLELCARVYTYGYVSCAKDAWVVLDALFLIVSTVGFFFGQPCLLALLHLLSRSARGDPDEAFQGVAPTAGPLAGLRWHARRVSCLSLVSANYGNYLVSMWWSSHRSSARCGLGWSYAADNYTAVDARAGHRHTGARATLLGKRFPQQIRLHQHQRILRYFHPFGAVASTGCNIRSLGYKHCSSHTCLGTPRSSVLDSLCGCGWLSDHAHCSVHIRLCYSGIGTDAC